MVQAALADPAVSPERGQELLHLLRHDCGSCHGLRLTGGLGPPLTPGALADKSASVLEHTITQGRPGTPMPPFGPLLSETEIRWLVRALRKGEAVDD